MKVISRKGQRICRKSHKRLRMISIILVATMLFSISFAAFAAAIGENTPKQEVVYINLNSDGSVQKVYVVNIFNLSEDGQIIDYGDYSALRNMTTNDKIVFDDETVRIDTKAGKLYYEGILNGDVIPWSFSIRYYIDDTEYLSTELAGKSGALKITMAVRQNSKCNSAFFNNYALQATFILDTKLCNNIVANGATAANVGKDRQLTYTLLPGKEKDISITADVTDFEMKPIAINGMALSMDVNADDYDNGTYKKEITDIEEAVAELDDGANELKDGAEELRDGASDLKDGTEDLYDGLVKAAAAALDLYDGADEIRSGANSLRSGAHSLYDGLNTLTGQNATLTDGAYSVFSACSTSGNTAKCESYGCGSISSHTGTGKL